MKHHNRDYTAGIPDAVGDRFYAQDLFRDQWSIIDESLRAIIEMFESFPILLTDPGVNNGTDFEKIDIPANAGIAKYNITVPNSYASIPPSTTTEDILVSVVSSAETDLDISGTATLDGVTTNYVKMQYDEANGSTRTRAKKAGSYTYDKTPSYSFVVSSVAPTDYDIVLAEVVGDGSSFLTISNYTRTVVKETAFEVISADTIIMPNKKYYVDSDSLINLTLPDLATQGDKIEIFTRYVSDIVQGDSENVISYLNKYFTTKGTSGKLRLFYKNAVELVYQGSGSSRVEPGVKLSDPATLPTGMGYGCDFSYDGIYLAVSHATSPYITIYKRSGDTFTKLSDPASLPASIGYGCDFSYDGIYLAVAHTSSPYITIYKRSGDTFTKLSDPASLPTGNALGCSFSYDGIYLAVAHTSSPYITIYKRSGDTFTKLSDPSSLPAGNARGCSFSYDGSYLAVVHSTTPFVTIYSRSGDTFTKLSDPASLPASTGNGCSFSYDGSYLAVAHDTSPYITIYKRSGDTFTKLSDPASLPVGNGNECDFSYDGIYLAVAHTSSPYITIYKRSGDTFTKLSDPASLPTSIGNECSFSYDGAYLAIANLSSPRVTIYKNIESASKTWLAKNLLTLNKDDKSIFFQ